MLTWKTDWRDDGHLDIRCVGGTYPWKKVESQERKVLIYEEIQGAVEDGSRFAMARPARTKELNISGPSRDEFWGIP